MVLSSKTKWKLFHFLITMLISRKIAKLLNSHYNFKKKGETSMFECFIRVIKKLSLQFFITISNARRKYFILVIKNCYLTFYLSLHLTLLLVAIFLIL